MILAGFQVIYKGSANWGFIAVMLAELKDIVLISPALKGAFTDPKGIACCSLRNPLNGHDC